MSPSPGDLQRYARRVGFGLAPGERIGDDPVGWAAAQLRVVPPIAIIEPDGTPRADLPAGLRLQDSGDGLMHAWQQAIDTVAAVRARSASLGEAAFRREQTERVVIPYYRLEHWKEVQARATTAVYGPTPEPLSDCTAQPAVPPTVKSLAVRPAGARVNMTEYVIDVPVVTVACGTIEAARNCGATVLMKALTLPPDVADAGLSAASAPDPPTANCVTADEVGLPAYRY